MAEIRFDRLLEVDEWLDNGTDTLYKEQPVAQHWARVSKIGEELGEAISELILMTGQNPRKGKADRKVCLLQELADVACTAILAIQHFTKDEVITESVMNSKILYIEERALG